jgi:hypothetical protein
MRTAIILCKVIFQGFVQSPSSLRARARWGNNSSFAWNGIFDQSRPSAALPFAVGLALALAENRPFTDWPYHGMLRTASTFANDF